MSPHLRIPATYGDIRTVTRTGTGTNLPERFDTQCCRGCMQHVVYKVVHRVLSGARWRYTRTSGWTYRFEATFFFPGDPFAGANVPDCSHSKHLVDTRAKNHIPCASARSCTTHIITHLSYMRSRCGHRVRTDLDTSRVASDVHMASTAMRYMWSEILADMSVEARV